MHGRSSKRQRSESAAPQSPEEVSLELIAQKLDRLTWRHRIWGVDERQAWHVTQRLDEMYRQLYREQQLRYEALLAEARSSASSAPPGEQGQTRPIGRHPTSG